MNTEISPTIRKTALALLATIYSFSFIDRVVIALTAQQLKADFKISDMEIGLLSGTAFAVANSLAALPIARLAERRSRKWITTGALMLASAFAALGAATGSFTQMLALRMGIAASTAGVESPSHSMVSDMYEPAKRASAMSILMLGIPIAAIVGSTLGGTIAQFYGWRATFLAVGGLGLTVALVSMMFVREPARADSADEHVSGIGGVFMTLMRDPCMRHLLIGVCIMGLATYGTSAFLPAFFARNFDLGAGQAGLAFGLLTGVGSLVGTLLGGFGAEHFAKRDPRWLVAFPGFGALIGAPIFILGLLQSNIYVGFPIMLLGSFFLFMVMGPAITAVHSVLGSRSRATGSALFLLMLNLVGQGMGPPLAGLVSDIVSQATFGSDFATQCAGGAGQIAGSACANAGAAGVRYAIAIFALLYLWSGAHLLWGARSRRLSGEGMAAA